MNNAPDCPPRDRAGTTGSDFCASVTIHSCPGSTFWFGHPSVWGDSSQQVRAMPNNAVGPAQTFGERPGSHFSHSIHQASFERLFTHPTLPSPPPVLTMEPQPLEFHYSTQSQHAAQFRLRLAQSQHQQLACLQQQQQHLQHLQQVIAPQDLLLFQEPVPSDSGLWASMPHWWSGVMCERSFQRVCEHRLVFYFSDFNRQSSLHNQ